MKNSSNKPIRGIGPSKGKIVDRYPRSTRRFYVAIPGYVVVPTSEQLPSNHFGTVNLYLSMIDGEINQAKARQSLEHDIVSINFGRLNSANILV